jgi:hypothetical protein
MRTIEKTIYTFDELSDKAKQRAREWYREVTQFDSFYFDSVIEDVKTVGAFFGIDIEKVYFSGFWSQGDGACFEGSYRYKPQWQKAIKGYAPKDAELLRIGKALQDAQKAHFYKIAATCKHSGYHYHSGCMNVDIEHLEDSYRDIKDSESDIKNALRAFADWVYRRLGDDYEYTNSNECVDENIIFNGYEFDENGERA